MKRVVIVVATVALLVVLGLAAQSWWRSNGHGRLTASGTLEARNITLGSKVGGRVVEVLAREGDRVDANQLLVRLDDAELAARVMQARGRLQQARANLAKLERGFRPEEVVEAQAAGAAEAERVQQLESERERARAEQVNAQLNFHRVNTLVEQGVMAQQTRDDAAARLKSANAALEAAEKAIASAEERARAARAVATKTERGFRKEDIDATRAEVTLAEGVLAEAEARYAEREVRAPAAAVVEVLDLRPGDLLPPNAPVVKLLEADQLYVVVYVPQARIGRIHVGQLAEVRVDSFPDQRFHGVVEQIRQQAEFLPRNVQTAEEREHQVIGVKLRVENPQNKLRAGIHADVTFVEAP
jgi:multidrug resistance efflux pump